MPKELTNDQKAQVLKDMIDLRNARQKAEILGMIPGYAKPLLDAGFRLLDTLTIAAGCYEFKQEEGDQHG